MLFEVGQQWALHRGGKQEAEGMETPNRPVLHAFSCEVAPPVQKWIQLAHDPQLLVSCISEMGNSMVRNVLDGNYVPRPKATAVFCGWVCHQAWLGSTCHFFKTFHVATNGQFPQKRALVPESV